MIPISSVRLGREEEELVIGVLRSGSIAQGGMVARFEQEFADLVGVQHAVAVNNGTTALVAALQVLDLQPGDEVITSPFTFVATLNAILEAGATATFADIRDDDFALDAAVVEDTLTARTKVILPVHLYGQMADMHPLVEIASRTGARILEDAAQSLGAKYDGRSAGGFGLGTFSLYATKNLTTGEGGVITTDDDGLADRLRVLRNQGMRERYVYEMAGHNYRMTDIQAAVGVPQLARYSENLSARRRNAAAFVDALSGIKGVVVPRELDGREHVWHQFTLRITKEASVSREEFVARLTESGVTTGIYYPKTVFDYDAYKDHPRVVMSDVPVAERVAGEVVSIPVHPELSPDDIVTITEAVREAAA